MYQKNLVLGMLAALFTPPVLFAAPGTLMLSGQIRYRDGNLLTESCTLRLPRLRRIETTASDGSFMLGDLPPGKITVQVWLYEQFADSFTVALGDSSLQLGPLQLVPLSLSHAETATTLNEAGSTEQVTADDAILPQAGMLLNSNDLFIANSFTFSGYGFRARAYPGQQQEVYLGGVLLNSPVDNQANFQLWSGLSEVMKAQRSGNRIEANADGPGGLSGSRNYLLHAPYQTPQRKFSYTLSNRGYDHRVQFFYCPEKTTSGMMYSCAITRQWAIESRVPATASDQYALYASAAKSFRKTMLAASLVYQNSYRELKSAATDEVYTLAGTHYYNANWGWQNGVKRNARGATAGTPLLALHCEHTPSENTQWSFALATQLYMQANRGLDWQDAPDPRPDYYRNLPSFLSKDNPQGAVAAEQLLLANPSRLQIDWMRLYETNQLNYYTHQYAEEGLIKNIYGRRALYVLASDVEQQHTMHFRTHVRHDITANTQLHASFSWNSTHAHRYKQLDDLLGGDYFLNHNTYAQQSYPGNADAMRNDLNTPDKELHKGDHYKYDYHISAQHIQLFAQLEKDFRRWTLFTSVSGAVNSMQRTGTYRNGLFPGQSFGKGSTLLLPAVTLKNGLTWKINGRHYLSARIYLRQTGPEDFDQAFVAPAMRDQPAAAAGMLQSVIVSAECAYIVHAPKWNIQFNAYQTERRNITQILRYYNDEPEYQCFVNMVQTHLNIRHTGLEFAASYDLSPRITLNGIAAIGQSYFSNNPDVRIFSDNDTALSEGLKKVSIRNYYAGAGPQTVIGAGCRINAPHRWSLKLNAGYTDRNYVRINAGRRSAAAAENIDPSGISGKAIFNQERLPAALLSDMLLSKSFRVRKSKTRPREYFIFFCYLSVSNILNRTDIKTSGYEQLRYNFTDNDPETFPNKYIYAVGRTYALGINFKW
ncbi:TonB-dependent receptor [Rurimicrobium arvi]|uniref:TonB-dependent receptor n=2 Tax=Rurimicrobium arvi TaxID=2049916 RepID=A0ABP8MEH8_9BACT